MTSKKLFFPFFVIPAGPVPECLSGSRNPGNDGRYTTQHFPKTLCRFSVRFWIPAFAGMTRVRDVGWEGGGIECGKKMEGMEFWPEKMNQFD